MDVRVDLHRLVDEVLDDDPRAALIAYRRLADEHLAWLEERVVRLARREQWTWARIGRLLGRSRQAVRQKHPDSLHPPRRAPRRAEYAEAERRRAERALAASGARRSGRRDGGDRDAGDDPDDDAGEVVAW
jgi:hypothetical protein